MKTMTYLDRLHAMRERAYDEARRALDDALAAGPGNAGFWDAIDRHDGVLAVRDLLTRESDRAWADRRVQR